MKERKKNMGWKNHSEKLKRRDQVTKLTAAQNSHKNTSYGSAKKQKKKTKE
jgi:hypothetical protein